MTKSWAEQSDAQTQVSLDTVQQIALSSRAYCTPKANQRQAGNLPPTCVIKNYHSGVLSFFATLRHRGSQIVAQSTT